MFNLQGSEIIVILLLALVVLGPEKLPDAIRRFTRTYNELKKMGAGFQAEFKSAIDEPMREMRETAELVRDAADPQKIQAEVEAARAQPAEDESAESEGAPVEPDAAIDRSEEPADRPPPPAAPVNQIAAANSSRAIEERTAAPQTEELAGLAASDADPPEPTQPDTAPPRPTVLPADSLIAVDQPDRLDDTPARPNGATADAPAAEDPVTVGDDEGPVTAVDEPDGDEPDGVDVRASSDEAASA